MTKTKTLNEYLHQYLNIMNVSQSEVTVPPRFWIFSKWQMETGVTQKTPEEGAAMLEEIKENQPDLFEVLMSQINAHLDTMREQEKLQKEGANIFEIVQAGNKREIISVEEGRAQAEELLSS